MLPAAQGRADTRDRTLPCPLPSAQAGLPPHLQLLVVLIGEVEEPGHVEEELGGVLQQQQDQAQAAQAGEGETSLSVPPRPTESRGAAGPARLPIPLPWPARRIFRTQLRCHSWRLFLTLNPRPLARWLGQAPLPAPTGTG